MSSSHFEHAIDTGRQTRHAAAKVRNSLLRGWRQRTFRRHLGRFIIALEQVPQSEAARLTTDDIRLLNGVVTSVVTEAEAFMAARKNLTLAAVEQDRFVVTEIYQLRAIVETLTRRVTADPAVMDVAWTVRTETGNQTKK